MSLEPHNKWRALPAWVFFGIFYLCLWKWVDVELIYHGGGQVKDFPSFYWGWEFARDFRTHPGGLMEYCSAFLAQSLCYSWFGALVLTGQAALIFLGIAGFLKELGAPKLWWLGCIPDLLLLAIYAKYRHYSAPVTNFTIAVLLLWFSLRFCFTAGWRRVTGLLVLVAFLFAAAPSGLVVFLPALAFSEFRRRARALELLLLFGLSSLVPWVEGAALFGFAPGEAYAKVLPLPLENNAWSMIGASVLVILYLLMPVGCLGGWLWQLGTARWRPAQDQVSTSQPAAAPPASKGGSAKSNRRDAKRKDIPPVPARAKPPRMRFLGSWPVETAILVAATLTTMLGNHSSQVKSFLAVDYFAWHGNWPEVIAAAAGNPRNSFVACAAAQAMFHTGMLTRQLPYLPTPSDLVLFSDKQQSHWKKSDLYFDLGYLNMALHHLTESVEFYGERPILLRRLALVNLALGNLPTAKVYLGTLARAPFNGRWARGYLDRIQADPTLASDEEVSSLRRLLVKRDFVLVLSVDEELLLLLGANRQNRMAFEYLMTYYLMTKNLAAFVKNISRTKEFAGFEISPLWDEALLLARQEGKALDLPGHAIQSEAQTRVDAVNRVLQNYSNNKELARKELYADYATTYSYYYNFHR